MYLDRTDSDTRTYTRPLEKLPASIIRNNNNNNDKSYLMTQPLFTENSPRGFVFAVWLDFRCHPPSSAPSAQAPQDTERENKTPLGQKLPRLSPAGATTAPPPQEEAKRKSLGKRRRSGAHAGPGAAGAPARPKALQSHPLAPAPDAAPRAAAPTSDVLQRIERILQNRDTGPVPLCSGTWRGRGGPWGCPWASEWGGGQRTHFATRRRFLGVLW